MIILAIHQILQFQFQPASEVTGPFRSSDLYELGIWVIGSHLFCIILRVNIFYNS